MRLRLADAEGREFGWAADGSFRNVLGGVLLPGGGSRPDRWIVPSGAYTGTLTGTVRVRG